MPAKKLKQKKTPQKKKAELDLLHDPVLRSGIVATLALFTLLLLIPLSPCKFIAGKTLAASWGMCGQLGWDSLSPGFFITDLGVLWLGRIDLAGQARWFVFAGLFGVLYLLYLKVYICCLTKCKCFCC